MTSNICSGFDTERLSSHSSAEGKMCVCGHFRSEFRFHKLLTLIVFFSFFFFLPQKSIVEGLGVPVKFASNKPTPILS